MGIFWPSRDERLARWLAQAAAGNRAAFQALYRALYDPVAGFISRRVASREDAEDLCARVFTRLVEQLASYDPKKGSVTTWVLAMARNAVIDFYRTRRAAVPLDDFEALLSDGAPSPLDALLKEEGMQALVEILTTYPPDLREMLSLHFSEGLRYREIASLMGLSEAAVKQRFSRAIREIRARLREQLGEAGEVDYVV